MEQTKREQLKALIQGWAKKINFPEVTLEMLNKLDLSVMSDEQVDKAYEALMNFDKLSKDTYGKHLEKAKINSQKPSNN